MDANISCRLVVKFGLATVGLVGIGAAMIALGQSPVWCPVVLRAVGSISVIVGGLCLLVFAVGAAEVLNTKE